MTAFEAFREVRDHGLQSRPFQLVPPGEEARFLSGLANQWLPGVGPKTANELNAAGLARIGQIVAQAEGLLRAASRQLDH